MDLSHPSQENLSYMLETIANKLSVANPALLDPVDYDLTKYDDLKWLYDHIITKDVISVSETEAFVEELSLIRK